MRKTMIVKLFIGSLIGLVGAVVLFLVAGGLALASGMLVMDGPDVVGVTPDPFGWVMIGLAGLALLVMACAGAGLFVAWIGAVLNTASLADKTWFIVLLVGGLLSVGFLVTIAYVIAGPDGHAAATPAVGVQGGPGVQTAQGAWGEPGVQGQLPPASAPADGGARQPDLTRT